MRTGLLVVVVDFCWLQYSMGRKMRSDEKRIPLCQGDSFTVKAATVEKGISNVKLPSFFLFGSRVFDFIFQSL